MSIHKKYEEALNLFRDTNLSRKEICDKCNLKVSSFGAYIRRHHRELLLEKMTKESGVELSPDAKLYGKSGQGLLTKTKYMKAILACRSLDFIQYNISQIAHHFKLNPTGLGNQLRAHYPDILEWRYAEQQQRGINTHQQKKMKEDSIEQYSSAIDMLRNSNHTLQEVAEKCNVSFTGLRQHVLFYHKDLVRKRQKTREKNTGQKYKGKKTGSNSVHEPLPETVLKYSEAFRLYSETSMTMKEIIQKTGVPYGGFYGYIRTWHRDLIEKRRGIKCEEDVEIADFTKYKHYVASTYEKYADAIAYMKTNDDVTTAATAKLYLLNPETFRLYLKEHEPELVSKRGMMKTSNGKCVSRKSYDKYRDAIEFYRTTTESLYSIAKRTSLNVISLGGFIRRNFPEYIEEHNKLIEQSKQID